MLTVSCSSHFATGWTVSWPDYVTKTTMSAYGSGYEVVTMSWYAVAQTDLQFHWFHCMYIRGITYSVMVFRTHKGLHHQKLLTVLFYFVNVLFNTEDYKSLCDKSSLDAFSIKPSFLSVVRNLIVTPNPSELVITTPTIIVEPL